MKSKNIYKKLLVRLPIYLNYLKSLPDSVEYVSATKIGEAVGLGDVLVRKELAKVSSGGKRRVGYLRGQLIVDIEKYLDSNCVINAIVVGVGNLGTALLNYSGFQDAGVNVLAGFDLNTKKPAAKTEKRFIPWTYWIHFVKKTMFALVSFPLRHQKHKWFARNSLIMT